jgi:DNA-binding CsgD family transcriptional regulator
MVSLRRLWRTITRSRASRMTFQMDQAMVDSLRDLADREQRHPEDLAQDLLAFALEERRHADENLKRWQDLSPREQQVAALACLNYTNRQIAALLVISPETVKTHIRNILQKFNLRSKAELRQALSDWDFSAWNETNHTE